MKALSLWQPWASLLLHPSEVYRKVYETRGWPFPETLIGKPLAIHATATIRREVREMLDEDLDEEQTAFFADALADLYPSEQGDRLHLLPLGAVLGTVRVVECRPTSQVNPTALEATFGNFGPDRYAWRTEVIERFSSPVPAKGAQGIWEWTWPTAEGLELMRHALGASHVGTGLGWRNYFLAGKEDRDAAVWEQLVSTGHAVRGNDMNDGRECYYRCSEKGIVAAKAGAA